MSPIFDRTRTPEQRRQAVSNLFDFFVKGGIADTTRMPSVIIDQSHKATLHRYLPVDGVPLTGDPILLVPPLGSQAICFDLRRGCSLVEHLLTQGRPTYLVDYGEISLKDRNLGIEFWVSEVVPNAVRKVSEDASRAMRCAWKVCPSTRNVTSDSVRLLTYCSPRYTCRG